MRVLAFDCSLRSLSVTILDGDRETTRREAAEQGGQAERLLPLIEDVRRDAGLAWTDIDRIAVTFGPGGFTSVRVGIAAARALALACAKPAVGISTLELLAATAAASDRPATGAHRLVAAVPAGKGGIYHQCFDAAGLPRSPATVIEASGLAHAIGPGDDLVGPGAGLILAALGSDSSQLFRVRADLEPSTSVLAARAPGLTPEIELRPIYLRPPDAKPQTGKGLARA